MSVKTLEAVAMLLDLSLKDDCTPQDTDDIVLGALDILNTEIASIKEKEEVKK